MEADVHIRKVATNETRSGNTRYVVTDDQGREYTTFRPAIGKEAATFEGRRAHISFHEEERNGFQNVYLDGISEPRDRGGGGGEPATVGTRMDRRAGAGRSRLVRRADRVDDGGR